MSNKTAEVTIGELIPNEHNARKISDEKLEMLKRGLEKFGDLGCIVRNLKTNRLVSGHQRLRALEGKEMKIIIAHRYEKPTKQGTIAEGYIDCEGECFKYREVNWPEKQERLAMVAANKQGGEWDLPRLRDELLYLDDGSNDMNLTGFLQKEMEKLMADYIKEGAAPTSVADVEQQSLKSPLTKDQMDALPADVRLVQLFLTKETQGKFLKMVRELQEAYGTETITETVFACVRNAAEEQKKRDK